MGWNDHVTFVETECLDCGVVSDWEHWDAVGQSRYVGTVGEFLGVNTERSGKCPNCGSDNGQVVEED